MPDFMKIHEEDSVAVALHAVAAGTTFLGVTAREAIPQGHKMALKAIGCGEEVIKYGFPIGHATKEILPGSWVHSHNMATNLSGEVEYRYEPAVKPLTQEKPRTFRILCAR